MAGSLGKPSGSMAPPNLVEKIQQQKELASLQQMAGKGEQVEKDKEAAKEEARSKEIDSLLPDKVDSAYGQLTYDTFKSIYKDVFDGVAMKEHFALGYLVHDAEMPGGGPFRVRTFRRSEANALRGLAPKMSVFDNADVGTFNAENSLYVSARLAVALVSFDGTDTELPMMPTVENLEKWIEDKQVKAKMSLLDGLPDELVGFISAVIQDVSLAYRLAATENLKNQLAPRSRSSA